MYPFGFTGMLLEQSALSRIACRIACNSVVPCWQRVESADVREKFSVDCWQIDNELYLCDGSCLNDTHFYWWMARTCARTLTVCAMLWKRAAVTDNCHYFAACDFCQLKWFDSISSRYYWSVEEIRSDVRVTPSDCFSQATESLIGFWLVCLARNDTKFCQNYFTNVGFRFIAQNCTKVLIAYGYNCVSLFSLKETVMFVCIQWLR